MDDNHIYINCTSNINCENGTCQNKICQCNQEYISTNNICDYHQLSGSTAYILSIVLGLCGVDWCFLARGNTCYIITGVLKGITIGCVGVCWIQDMINGHYVDGNGHPLTPRV